EGEVSFALALELTLKAHWRGWRLAEVPTTWRDRTAGQSRFRLWAWLPHYLRWYLRAIGRAWVGHTLPTKGGIRGGWRRVHRRYVSRPRTSACPASDLLQSLSEASRRGRSPRRNQIDTRKEVSDAQVHAVPGAGHGRSGRHRDDAVVGPRRLVAFVLLHAVL